jgi:hypothetical protein
MMGLLVVTIETAFGIVSYLLGIALFWHFRRIGKAWIGWVFWSFEATVALALLGIATSYGIAEPGAEAFVVIFLFVVMAGGILTAPFWNPLPPRGQDPGPDELNEANLSRLRTTPSRPARPLAQ